MIHWLMQSAAAHPDLAQGLPPAGLLSEVERDRLAQLTTEKRRRDWLCGRWTAKLLLQTLHREKTGHCVPLDCFSIVNNADGVPLITGHWSLATGYALSLSHSHDHAFCAIVTRPQCPIGADLERIETRGDGFVEDYFTEAEKSRILLLPQDASRRQDSLRSIYINATWSAKEAALKALHLGLSVDTRAVECLIEPFTEPPTDWTPFTVHGDDARLPCPAPPLIGWWRVQDAFVLTVAVGANIPDDTADRLNEKAR
ncbi:MAG: 4'-phosphopantetheinyl transferase superfamily protein [Anaerolineae bacterium]|nr:4'-phosphopantetheinyl transferase superfamily protein [Anaerolineae bacterium]